MKEIKFRAWDALTKEMYSHEQLCDPAGDGTSLTFSEFIGFGKHGVVVMQFTGLTDKNGREIYEGDVVQDEDGQTAVYWSDAMGAWAVQDPDDCAFLLADCNSTMEVVGHIYEEAKYGRHP